MTDSIASSYLSLSLTGPIDRRYVGLARRNITAGGQLGLDGTFLKCHGHNSAFITSYTKRFVHVKKYFKFNDVFVVVNNIISTKIAEFNILAV